MSRRNRGNEVEINWEAHSYSTDIVISWLTRIDCIVESIVWGDTRYLSTTIILIHA